MGIHTIKLPDVGEGVAEAEFVELHVAPGDTVGVDQNLADVMTDKATVEIPSPRAGKVVWIGPEVGETVSVGSEIIKIEIDGEGNTAADEVESAAPVVTPEPEPAPTPIQNAGPPKPAVVPDPVSTPQAAPVASAPSAAGRKPMASPAVRARARARSIDLSLVAGSGPDQRITHNDLDAFVAAGGVAARPMTNGTPDTSVEEVNIIGLRRKIAEKMQLSKRNIPHITYVDEVEMDALEELRNRMNLTRVEGQPKLTLLPFLMRAIVLASKQFPHVNARFDEDQGVLEQFGGVHIGIATQTDGGLMVPVVRHAEANDIWTNAREVKRMSTAARDGSAKRDELSGSTITITSLGAIGGLVTTPVINHPEVAIVGVNKIQALPRYDAYGNVVPKRLMNLSSSFDHRIVDGYDAAQFVQTLKGYLEFPATLFA